MSANTATREFAMIVAKSLVAPGVADTQGSSFPTVGAPKQLVTVHGNASMTVASGVTSVVAYMDALSFRSGQLSATLVGRNSAMEPIQSMQVPVGTKSSDFSAGSVLSLSLMGENTSGDDAISGTVAAGVTHDLIDNAQGMTHAKLERQTEYKDFVYRTARDGAANAIAITPYLTGGSAYVGRGASTNVSKVIESYTTTGAAPSAANGFASAFSAATTDVWQAKNVTADKDRYLNGAAKTFDLLTSVRFKAPSGAAAVAPGLSATVTFVDGTEMTKVIVPTGTVAGTDATYATGSVSVPVTKPVADVKVIAVYGSGSNTRVLENVTVAVEESYECADIPEASRAFVVFEGLKPGNSIVSLRCAATLSVTPSPENISLMHRAPVSTDIDYSLFVEFVTAFIRDVPMAFTPESRTLLLELMDSPRSVQSIQLAFDVGRGFRQVGRGLRKFGHAAKEARHVVSQIAKVVDPIFQVVGAAGIPELSQGAQMGSLMINGAQNTRILQAASRDYM